MHNGFHIRLFTRPPTYEHVALTLSSPDSCTTSSPPSDGRAINRRGSDWGKRAVTETEASKSTPSKRARLDQPDPPIHATEQAPGLFESEAEWVTVGQFTKSHESPESQQANSDSAPLGASLQPDASLPSSSTNEAPLTEVCSQSMNISQMQSSASSGIVPATLALFDHDMSLPSSNATAERLVQASSVLQGSQEATCESLHLPNPESWNGTLDLPPLSDSLHPHPHMPNPSPPSSSIRSQLHRPISTTQLHTETTPSLALGACPRWNFVHEAETVESLVRHIWQFGQASPRPKYVSQHFVPVELQPETVMEQSRPVPAQDEYECLLEASQSLFGASSSIAAMQALPATPELLLQATAAQRLTHTPPVSPLKKSASKWQGKHKQEPQDPYSPFVPLGVFAAQRLKTDSVADARLTAITLGTLAQQQPVPSNETSSAPLSSICGVVVQINPVQEFAARKQPASSTVAAPLSSDAKVAAAGDEEPAAAPPSFFHLVSIVLGDHTRDYFRVTIWRQRTAWASVLAVGDLIHISHVSPTQYNGTASASTSFKSIMTRLGSCVQLPKHLSGNSSTSSDSHAPTLIDTAHMLRLAQWARTRHPSFFSNPASSALAANTVPQTPASFRPDLQFIPSNLLRDGQVLNFRGLLLAMHCEQASKPSDAYTYGSTNTRAGRVALSLSDRADCATMVCVWGRQTHDWVKLLQGCAATSSIEAAPVLELTHLMCRKDTSGSKLTLHTSPLSHLLLFPSVDDEQAVNSIQTTELAVVAKTRTPEVERFRTTLIARARHRVHTFAELLEQKASGRVLVRNALITFILPLIRNASPMPALSANSTSQDSHEILPWMRSLTYRGCEACGTPSTLTNLAALCTNCCNVRSDAHTLGICWWFHPLVLHARDQSISAAGVDVVVTVPPNKAWPLPVTTQRILADEVAMLNPLFERCESDKVSALNPSVQLLLASVSQCLRDERSVDLSMMVRCVFDADTDLVTSRKHILHSVHWSADK